MSSTVQPKSSRELVAGSPVQENLQEDGTDADSQQDTILSILRRSDSSASMRAVPQAQDSSSSSRLKGESKRGQPSLKVLSTNRILGYINKSWCIRIKNLFHLGHDVPDGYTYDIRLNPIIPSLDDYQPGYGKVAAIEGCDPSLNIYRKFEWLHHRALLHLQDELGELEGELQRLDEYDFTDGDPVRLVSRRHDDGTFQRQKSSDRSNLIDKVNAKMQEYDELLPRTRNILALRRPTERAQRSLYSLITNTGSLVKQESQWVRYSADLAALSGGAEHGWFSDKLRDVMNFVSKRLTMFLLTTDEQRQKAGKEVVQLTSPYRRDLLLRIILTILVSILLLFPISILSKLRPLHPSDVQRKSDLQLLTILLFTTLFGAGCSVLTQARRQEVFQATAAYCAILVIFLGKHDPSVCVRQ